MSTGSGERLPAPNFFSSVGGLIAQDPGPAVLGALAMPPNGLAPGGVIPAVAAPLLGIVNSIVNRPLAQRQMMVAGLVTRVYPEANLLWGLGVCTVVISYLLGNITNCFIAVLRLWLDLRSPMARPSIVCSRFFFCCPRFLSFFFFLCWY